MGSVQLEHVDKVYPDGFKAVTDLNLSIEDGEFMILVGPYGCGKSTALRMIAGLEEISGGKLSIGGQVVNDLTPKERDIAMVFQSYALYPHMTVAENMGFALKLAKVSKDEIERRVRDAAELLDLTDHLDRKPKALSGGQRQRVAMGRAIVRSPQAFLMDEPLSNLDAKLRVQMRAEISALQARLGVTTVYVTHDQVEAMTMGDRVAVLKLGVLQQVDAPQFLYDHPDNLFVAGFIGSPAMNLGSARLSGTPGRPLVDVGDGEHLVVSDAALAEYPGVADRIGDEVVIGMRPEHFTREAAAEGAVWHRRRVGLVEMLGAEMLVHFDTHVPPVLSEDMRSALDDEDAHAEMERAARKGGQQFVARLDPAEPPRPGDVIDIGFDVDHLHFFDAENGQALR